MKRSPGTIDVLSRRRFLKSLGAAPLLLRTSPLFAAGLEPGAHPAVPSPPTAFPFADVRLTPHYPAESPLADVLKLVAPGSDQYISERYAVEIESLLHKCGAGLRAQVPDVQPFSDLLDAEVTCTPLGSPVETQVRSGSGVHVVRRNFPRETVAGKQGFLKQLAEWIGPAAQIETTEFEIYGLEVTAASPLSVRTAIRYDIVQRLSDDRKQERVGAWQIDWTCLAPTVWRAHRWTAGEETIAMADGPIFVDVSARALGTVDSYREQLLRGADHWRTVLDGAIGVDVYANNGLAAGDYDNDGFDDLYICQAAGLPNRLYRNRGDGTFEDVTERAGVGVLDSTACALFADFDNRGLQDLLVVCGTGPLLFRNQGDGRFQIKRDAFKFARPAQGTFTHAALADYDRDGRLDIYFCTYMYYLGLDQYHYPAPYYDARNGPPNCLFHNEGNGVFVESTQQSGLNADNDRYSFSCAWGDAEGRGLQDLFVVNDFGSSQLYRNNGDGTFKVVSHQANVEDVGAGMSCAWCDYDNDGRQDVYVPSMWEAAGQRVSAQPQFHALAPEKIRALYQRHARGNALYRNGGGVFENVGNAAGVEMGRWSWSSDFWDFDHDGFSDLYVANGYISSLDRNDLAGFFWRQVVAKSSEDATASQAYEHGWNAINELIRSDHTWHGYARNVMFVNNRNGTFSEISAPSGLDFIEDSRSFALADLDHDGRLEVVLKNRNAPQLRILHNELKSIGKSVAFKLRGRQSNRDATGASITLQAGLLRQTKYLQAGSGFLAQHSKELFFGVGSTDAALKASVRWPNGLIQNFDAIPANHRIEVEEGEPTFTSKPFAEPRLASHQAAMAEKSEPLPQQVETWLVEPCKAPQFSLPDLAGKSMDLAAQLGGPVLLAFWATHAESSLNLLGLLHRHRGLLAAARLRVLALNVDDAGNQPNARSFATRKELSFPVLFATEEAAGIYNIIYRHLFDRHRDMGIPTCMLLDPQGFIVKVYQGTFDVERLPADISAIPATDDERLRKAIPFPGVLFQDAFARNQFTYGVSMYQHGYLSQAEESFQQVLERHPQDADAHYNLGTLALRRSDFAQARQSLIETLRLRPNYPEAWNNLGMMAAQQGNLDEAVKDFQASLELRPRYAIALLNLGNVYRRQRDFSRSQQVLLEALALQPDDPEINYSLGMLYAQQDQMQSASDYLEKALSLRPGYPEALGNLGVLYVREQNYPKAEEQFRAAIQAAPTYDQAYLNLARLYAIQGDKAQARDVLKELLRIQPKNAAAQQTLERLQ